VDDAAQNVAPRGRLRARLVVTLLPLSMLVAIAAFADRPMPYSEESGGQRRAALAIRDPVDPVETLATWAFVRPRLEAAYADVRTVTETHRGDPKSREAFVAGFADLAKRFSEIDVWCLAHTNDYVDWLAVLPRGETTKIRLVYNSGCECGEQAPRWLDLGATTYVGHPGTAPHAPFCALFLRRWLSGLSVRDAVDSANAQARTYLEPFAAVGFSALSEFLVSPGEVHGDGRLVVGGVGPKSRPPPPPARRGN
jgi:hypothetical protein